MDHWIRLKETERAAYVEAYATKKPPALYISTTERRRDAYSG